MAHTQHEVNIINEDRQHQAKMMQEHLEKMDVSVRMAHYTGDSSYPTEYTITHKLAQGSGPTFDLALLDWIEELLKSDTVTSYKAMETALQVLTGNILNMRTELLIIKAEVTKDKAKSED
jgi:hypothetical protein